MNQPTETVYDELPYESLPVPGTGPRRLALCSLLHGGPRPPLERFRALEIGCNNGSNLLPMAFYHPDSEFVGVDSAESALAAGRAAAAVLELANLRLDWIDLREPTAVGGTYDYVIVHGVFSWVDATAREGILRLSAEHLAPDGVLYLSHNVDAGWRIRGLVRDVVIEGVAGLPTAADRNRRAREIAGGLHGIVAGSKLPYHVLLAEELQRVTGSTESYLAHETLSTENVAFRHDEVVALLAAHGFDYLADALYDRPEGRVPFELQTALADLGTHGVEAEQLADVLGYRRFRSSVFCRSAARGGGPVESIPDDLYVSGTSDEIEDDDPPIDAEFSLPADEQLAAALLLLAAEWPAGMRVSELIARSGRLVESAPMAADDIRRRLLKMHWRGRVELSLVAPHRRTPSGTPVPHRLARFQAARGQDLTTAIHWPIGLDPIDRAIIGMLGEGRDVGEIAAELERLVAAGEYALPESVAPGADAEGGLRTMVLEVLETLGRWGLLE